MKTETLKARLTFIEEALGTASANAHIHEEYIASKSEDAEKIEEEIERLGVDAVVEKAMTVFPRTEDGEPMFWDYQIKGFFKDTCGALKRVSDSLSAGVTAFKKEIDGNVFIMERIIPIDMHGGEIGNCQRPLRGQTAQREITALANSETVPKGSTIDITIMLLPTKRLTMDVVKEWLDYGRLRGIGQWRNSGKGRFTWEEIKEAE